MSTRTSALVLLLLALSPVARAQQPQQPPQQDSSLDEAARITFENGRQCFASGDYECALARFRQAYDLSHRPGLLYNIAQTLDRLRRDRETLDTLRQYLAAQPDAQNRAEVESRIRVLEDAIAHNHIATPISTSHPPLHPAIFLAAGGLAVVAGGLGIVFGLLTMSANDTYNAQTTYAAALGPYNDANTFQLLTNIFYISAGVAAVGAVITLFFTDWGALSGGSPAPATASILPTFSFGPNGASMGALLRF